MRYIICLQIILPTPDYRRQITGARLPEPDYPSEAARQIKYARLPTLDWQRHAFSQTVVVSMRCGLNHLWDCQRCHRHYQQD